MHLSLLNQALFCRFILPNALAAIAATGPSPANAQAGRSLAYQVSPLAGPLTDFSMNDAASKT